MVAQSGSAAFTNPDDYRAGIGISGANVNFVPTGDGNFSARLTWLKQRHFHLLLCRESVPRIACVSLAPTRAFVSFPASVKTALIWGGVELKPGDILFHSRGERGHQRTERASKWALVSLPLSQLTMFSKSLMGHELIIPPFARIVRPPKDAVTRLQDLHAAAIRVAETKPEILGHEEVARTLQHDYVHALVHCLTAEGTHVNVPMSQNCADIVLRFEDALVDHTGRGPSIAQLCTVLGVTERTLRMCCTLLLGVSPSRYIRLRQQHMARATTLACWPHGFP
ncbi:MAG TPA: AraC family transcriptional regulator [Pseudolabrys sp.]|nr:AraC family transcriptional regulator [Pseudolabrys sp.]